MLLITTVKCTNLLIGCVHILEIKDVLIADGGQMPIQLRGRETVFERNLQTLIDTIMKKLCSPLFKCVDREGSEFL